MKIEIITLKNKGTVLINSILMNPNWLTKLYSVALNIIPAPIKLISNVITVRDKFKIE